MKQTSLQKNRHFEKGFTLIELMVSLTIFSIVMLISTGTLLIMIDVNAKAQAINSSTTNITFAIDSMTREIRTGYHYWCGTPTNDNLPGDKANTANCTGKQFISFTREEDGAQVGYRLNGSKIEKKIKPDVGLTTDWTPLTSDDVVIDAFTLNVVGSPTQDLVGDVSQPVVDFVIEGYVKNGLDTNTDFRIQSTIVQRRLDII